MRTLLASFGSDTLFSILEGNLRVLNFICATLENTEFQPKRDSDGTEVYHPHLRRLTFCLLNKIYLSEDCSRVVSYMQKIQAKTTERDVLLKIGRSSPSFTLVGAFNCQEDFREMIQSATPQVSEELNNCFFETKSTRQIQLLDWPRDRDLLTMRSERCKVTKEELDAQLASEPDKVTRVVTVRVLNLGWFYRDKKNFAAFSKMLQ